MSKLYQITCNSDLNDGSGATIYLNIYFKNNSSALEFIRSTLYKEEYGIQGQPGRPSSIKEIEEETLVPKIYLDVKDYEIKNNTSISVNSQDRKKLELSSLSKEDLVNMLLKQK